MKIYYKYLLKFLFNVSNNSLYKNLSSYDDFKFKYKNTMKYNGNSNNSNSNINNSNSNINNSNSNINNSNSNINNIDEWTKFDYKREIISSNVNSNNAYDGYAPIVITLIDHIPLYFQITVGNDVVYHIMYMINMIYEYEDYVQVNNDFLYNIKANDDRINREVEHAKTSFDSLLDKDAFDDITVELETFEVYKIKEGKKELVTPKYDTNDPEYHWFLLNDICRLFANRIIVNVEDIDIDKVYHRSRFPLYYLVRDNTEFIELRKLNINVKYDESNTKLILEEISNQNDFLPRRQQIINQIKKQSKSKPKSPRSSQASNSSKPTGASQASNSSKPKSSRSSQASNSSKPTGASQASQASNSSKPTGASQASKSSKSEK